MLNRRGLELLFQIDNIPKEYAHLLEDQRIPSIFRQFLKNYKIGANSLRGEKIRLNDEHESERVLTKITMYEELEMEEEKYHAVLDYIFDYGRLEQEMMKYENETENWNKLGFMQIGIMHWSDVLLIGMRDENLDEIWRYGQGLLSKVCSKLENDIFKFVSKLKESVQDEDLAEWNISKNHIYRNLNEDFWRVK